jgi:hypothetical protein
MNQIASDYLAIGEDFTNFVKSVDDAVLNKPGKDGEWSAAFAIHHLADFELHFATRILVVLTETNPNIYSHSEESYASKLNYDKRDVRKSVASISALRQQIGQILSLISDDKWDNPAVHSENGAIKLSDIVNSANKHAKNHLQQVKEAI